MSRRMSFHPPGRDPRAELHRLGEAPVLNAGPPRRLADGYEPVAADYGAQAKEAGDGKVAGVRHCAASFC